LDSSREAGTRTDSARLTPACSAPPSAAPARGGAFVEKRRVVAGECGGCGREELIQSSRAVWRSKREMGFGLPVSAVEWPAMDRGYCSSIRFARLVLERMTYSTHRRTHCHLPCVRPRLAARSSMSGALLWRRRRVGVPTRVRLPGRVVRRGRCGVGHRRAVRFTRLEIEWIIALFTPARLSPPSAALRPHIAGRSPMRGASWRRRR
jgi:hypothetical protein